MKTIKEFDEYEQCVDCNKQQLKNYEQLVKKQERIARWEHYGMINE